MVRRDYLALKIPAGTVDLCIDMADKSMTQKVKELAASTGFARVGITSAGPVGRFERYRKWLDRRWCGRMDYVRRNLDVRADSRLILQGARSVICLAVGYAPRGAEPAGAFVARYARGRDYHRVVKSRAGGLMEQFKRCWPGFCGRAFVDSGPLVERSLAASAGLGWIGKNGCLIAPGLGSYVVLGEIVCNLPLEADGPIQNGCHNCRRCVDACPGGALDGEGLIDARRCVSYLTIEHRGVVEVGHWPAIGQCVFGCDACQQVCPFNNDAPPGDAELTTPVGPGSFHLADILTWSQSDWDLATRGSARRRVKWEGWIRNAAISAGNQAEALGPNERTRLGRMLEALIRRTDLPEELMAAVKLNLGRFS